ncbi:unnamed protein product [Urochloa decumbens]|uniref:Uncharacterized protein n=1 Tax=Urochloa decumbens TaxID=240449 RepID=A0ABC8WMG0_9POAL
MGEIVAVKVFFETPFGFAIFCFDGGFLNEANDIETLWTHFVSKTTASLAILPLGFEMFENKLDAINPISRITCQYDEAVLEVMWGLKNLLHTLLPQEKSELSEEDSKHRSRGLQFFLRRHGFSIEPQLVDGQMAKAACFVYHCIEIDKEILECFHEDEYLEEEGINTNGWNALKYATALLLMCTDEPSSGPDQASTLTVGMR